ncbi:hypothetical protein [Mucilaginibacter gotjawali]|uniref:Uncharacterized protein n=2 Tax=Mucilaginibacter gotjawali TaxID=1550579 RepID=A0A110AZT2_9SPHI|nr:hypothetical protein [Mucilaginibacter gotjawali]MBB3058022.1 hypothetical protein [Mucilaginibacter gotjawali]BAU51998.1 hypothetical protein MgSA37_00148 [Mucilaginibacter gotjawali]
MKTKHLAFLLLLLSVSCKVTKKGLIGTYRAKGSNFNIIIIKSDHSFFYENLNPLSWLMTPSGNDSTHFFTAGTWQLDKNQIVLNSCGNNYADTSRVLKILKTPTKSNESMFLIRNAFGGRIPFQSVDNHLYNKTKIASQSVVDNYFWKIDLQVSKNDTLVFFPVYYEPFKFIVRDSVNANYIITLQPIYKQAYFINKKLMVKRNILKDVKEKFKKVKTAQNDSSL